MEPQLPSPSRSPESNGPAHFEGGETFSAGNKLESAPNVNPDQRQERGETREQHTGGPQGDPAAAAQQAALPALPTVPANTPQDDTSHDDTSTNPPSAANEDLIEKEWVEKAKKVVSQTRQDPYQQGQEVSRLQADYLKKRYGKTVKLPTEEQG